MEQQNKAQNLPKSEYHTEITPEDIEKFNQTMENYNQALQSFIDTVVGYGYPKDKLYKMFNKKEPLD